MSGGDFEVKKINHGTRRTLTYSVLGILPNLFTNVLMLGIHYPGYSEIYFVLHGLTACYSQWPIWAIEEEKLKFMIIN